MFIFESALSELIFYFFALFWFIAMPKRSTVMAILIFLGSSELPLADTVGAWCVVMVFMTFTYKKFALPFLVGFGFGSGWIQDWFKGRDE